MKQVKLLFLFLFLIGVFVNAQSLKGYKLVWQDNFCGHKLDTSSWNNVVAKPRWVNNELQRYTDGQNVMVKNGKLIIEARNENDEYTSGRINTKSKRIFTYGIVKIKAKLPEGIGTWPALWMLGQNKTEVGWPKCGELDIMEHVGKNPDFIHSSVHNKSGYAATPYTGKLKINNTFDKFHIYSMEWTTDYITFYVDGKKIYHYQPEIKNEENWPFDKPFFLIFNIAIGGDWGGAKIDEKCFPAIMKVDWVKVYNKKL